MPAQNTGYSVKLTAESMRTLGKLKTADLMPELRKELKAATETMQPTVRQAARDLPSSRKGKRQVGTSLRRSVANSIRRKTKISTREVLIAITSVPTGGKSNLGRVLEGEIPWRHPTYGHDPTVTQKPEPFFYRTIDALLPGVAARIEAVLTEMEAKL